ncbi:MAG: hypothetical protein OEL89_00230 [Candidatus Peregrinibacteria bacterium]|nr:hypothetical protein [Candidatus Peregrinibacteria bacterium]
MSLGDIICGYCGENQYRCECYNEEKKEVEKNIVDKIIEKIEEKECLNHQKKSKK